MKKLSSLLSKKKFQIKEIDEKTVFFIVKRIILREFGTAGQENISPEKYFKNMLILKSSSSLWASEFWLRQKIFLKKINKEIGRDVVKKIKLI
jgi:hypothetical protein